MKYSSKKTFNKKFGLKADTTTMFIVMLTVFVTMALMRPSLFLTSKNFTSMGFQLPELGFFSMAMMIAMLSGGIDLSIVSIANLSCILAAFILKHAETAGFTGGRLALSIILAVLTALLIGAVCGLLNGVLIAFLPIDPMLVTMATAQIFTGISIVLTGGKTVSKVSTVYRWWGNKTVLSIPIPFILMVIVLIIIGFMLEHTRLGSRIRMVGANRKASIYSGINVTKTLILTYLITALLSAICGLEILARTDTAKADYALTYVFQAILCAVLGSTDPDGGYANIVNLSFALLSLQFLSSGFNMLRLGGFFKEFAWGLILIIVLSFGFIGNKIREKKSKRELRKEC